jgi:hypothetical protein
MRHLNKIWSEVSFSPQRLLITTFSGPFSSNSPLFITPTFYYSDGFRMKVHFQPPAPLLKATMTKTFGGALGGSMGSAIVEELETPPFPRSVPVLLTTWRPYFHWSSTFCFSTPHLAFPIWVWCLVCFSALPQVNFGLSRILLVLIVGCECGPPMTSSRWQICNPFFMHKIKKCPFFLLYGYKLPTSLSLLETLPIFVTESWHQHV